MPFDSLVVTDEALRNVLAKEGIKPPNRTPEPKAKPPEPEPDAWEKMVLRRRFGC